MEVLKPKWDWHIEWIDMYKFVSQVWGVPWRGEVDGHYTYRESRVDTDPEGPEDFWDEGGRTPLQVVEAFTSQVAPIDEDCDHEDKRACWHADIWWRDESHPPDTHLALWDMCRRGLIPAGEYLITQDW